MDYKHPSRPLAYTSAIAYTESWLTENALNAEARTRGWTGHVVDYLDGDAVGLLDRPYLGVRVSEVDFRGEKGGYSYMQTDMPWGVAVCGQAERCVIALIECWNDEHNGDGTDEEFDRLAHLFTLTEKEG